MPQGTIKKLVSDRGFASSADQDDVSLPVVIGRSQLRGTANRPSCRLRSKTE